MILILQYLENIKAEISEKCKQHIFTSLPIETVYNDKGCKIRCLLYSKRQKWLQTNTDTGTNKIRNFLAYLGRYENRFDRMKSMQLTMIKRFQKDKKRIN